MAGKHIAQPLKSKYLNKYESDMTTKNCQPDSILASWAICSPQALQRSRELPNSTGWKEISGDDVYIYLRLTKNAARALAQRLLDACESENPSVLTDQSRPEGTISDMPLDHEHGFFIHPRGSSLTIEIHEMENIQNLLEEKAKGDERFLSPVEESSVFRR